MKVMATTGKVILLLFLLTTFCKNVVGQQAMSSSEKQADFIYNFFQYIDWPNFDDIEHLNIGVIGDTNNLVYDELVKICATKKAKEKSIAVNRLKGIDQLENIQLLYFDKASGLDIKDVYAAIGTKPILLVSKDYSYGKSMINFVMIDNKVYYELNKKKCEGAGLKVNLVITMLAIKSEEEWDSLLDKIEDLANTEDKTVKIDTKDLNNLIKEQKQLLSEIELNTKKLAQQKDKLKAQEADLQAKEKLIADTKKEIEEQKQLIRSQLDKIAVQQQNLATLNSNVAIKQQELTQQQEKLETEKQNLLAIQKEYADIEVKLKEKELLVNKQGKTIEEQVNDIFKKKNTIKSQQSVIWLSLIFLIIVSALGILAYRSYRLKNKANKIILSQKEEIEEQHKVLEEQHKEITDSINYAKRIQDAILPPLKLVRGYMPDSFILYKPKDIVAGDFYWMEGINNLIIFATADCTGHGVPGAMVSVVCHNAMNRAVREFMLIEPNEILDKTREIVLETFEKSAEQVNDGMDIALCTINTETYKLNFSGANNSLYLIRNGEIIQLKADKQPIGKYEDAKPFTKHEMDLEKGDVIYTFSDGFPDQFGGDKGKKFMYKPFREMLLAIHEKPMDEQHDLLLKAFNDWKGDIEQIDDVCVIGVRIT